MKTSITTEEARQILNKYLQTETLRLHCMETEAIMRKLAIHFGRDEDFWGITGLLHDLDLDIIKEDYQFHGKKTVDLLKEEGYNIPELFEAILAHTESIPETGGKRTMDFHYILAAAENITGLITAYVLMKPDKKIAGTEIKSISKRLKERRFAASVNREFIYDIEKTGIALDQFIKLSIDAMKEIAEEIKM
jgi:uncharacterized protein